MDAQTLREVMQGNLPNGGYTKLIDGYNYAMRAANINTVKRAAMFAAQLGHESVGLSAMEEYASGAAYEGRRDLGNIYPGDGKRYKGSGPIQLTGRNNFRAFTKWAQAQGHTTLDFEARPELVREVPKWGFLAASWYWTVARPDLNRASDAGDVLWASRLINGWVTTPNGMPDRRRRYAHALSFGTRLLPTTTKQEVTAVRPKAVHPMGEENGTWRVSSGYGSRWGSMHAGLDFAAPLGTPIYAVADGVIIQGKDRAPGSVSGFGNWVWLDAQASVGRDFIYGHMRHHEIYVKAGDRVKAGDLIARVGSEGGSTGPHLHFEVWRSPGRTGGAHEDPAPWLANNLNSEELTMAEVDRIVRAIREEGEKTRKHNEAWFKGFNGPIGSDVKDIRQQLTGGRDAVMVNGRVDLAASYPGWDIAQLVKNAEAKGYKGLTSMELQALAAQKAIEEEQDVKDDK